VAKVEFVLPDVGEGLEEGEIVSWLVAPGDTVARDQPLVEVQTDKALVELPSPVAGQIVSVAFAPGDIVKVGQVLVVLEDGLGGDTAPPSPPAATTSAVDTAAPATPPGADAASIGAECRRRGIVFALDGIQGLGALRLDAARLDCDFVAAGSGKWLLASPGFGFAWFAPRLIECVQPLSVGTSSVKENTQYFEPHLDWTDTARRFEEAGTSWQNIAALRAAVELINEVGIDDIEERVLTLSSRLGEGLAELGYEVIEPWPRRRSEASGIVSFRGGRSHQELLEVMKAAGVVCRTHRDFVRLSPHFYNTEEEVDAVLSALGPVTSR
jgi:selenocysteine lyase/cysteine desulfurase